MRTSRVSLGLLFVVGAFSLAHTQSRNALQLQAELTQQLQREYPSVLVYLEGDQVRRVWGKPFGSAAPPLMRRRRL
jgi:hypothetical protein